MAKPTWITIVGGTSGSGSATRSIKAGVHTGRSSRSGSIKGTTTSGATDTMSIVQAGAVEFINVDEVNYSVTALGGVITITGTSNSPSLKISSGSNSSSLSGWSLKVNKSSVTWNGGTTHRISGDPGATATYSFEISVTVDENKTESAKSITFEITDSGSKPTSGTITISQATGVKTYGTETVYLSYTTFKIPASGGKTELIYSFSIPWGWNGKTNSGKLTQADTKHNLSFAYVDNEPSSPFNWSLDKSTGQVTMASLGKNITSGSGVVHIKMTIEIPSINKSYSATDYVRQEGNSVSYSLSSIIVSHEDIPASGGSADSPVLGYASGIKSYSSGDSETTWSIPESEIKLTLSKTVNAPSLGTTIKARTKLDTVTVTATWNGATKTQSLDIYQQANAILTYTSITATSQSFTVDKTGGEFSVKDSPSQRKTFTSGSTLDVTDFAYSFDKIPAYVTVDELTLTATVAKNITGSSRSGSINVTITGENNTSTTVIMSFTQAACAKPYWNAPATYTFDSNGQGDNDPMGITVTITDTDNAGWVIDGPSYVGVSSTDKALPYIGTGTKTISLGPSVNTGTTQREFVLTLVNEDGTSKLGQCSCVQATAAVAEDTVSLGLGINNSDGLFDFASGYPSVIISPWGDYTNAVADGIELGKMSEPTSEYVNVDAVKSKLSDLKSKLSGDWKKNSYLYVIVVGGTTNSDTVYDSESGETTFYNSENFCLCEIDRGKADFDTVVDDMVNGTGHDIESDCITEEYGTTKHVIFKANTSNKSTLAIESDTDFSSSDKAALYFTLDIDGTSTNMAIYPLRTVVDQTANTCEMYVYRMIPLPTSSLKITDCIFETTQTVADSYSMVDGGNAPSIIVTAGNMISSGEFKYISGYFDESLIDTDTVGASLDLKSDITVSPLDEGDVTVTIQCSKDYFMSIQQ